MNTALSITMTDFAKPFRKSDGQLVQESVLAFLTDGEFSSMPANVKRFRADATRGQRLAAKVPFVRTGLVRLNDMTAAAQHHLSCAGRDIALAAANGTPRAAAALEAFDAMQPRIDELFTELASNPEAELATEIVLDVLAEVRAVAAALLAQETVDVTVPHVPEAYAAGFLQARINLIRSIAG